MIQRYCTSLILLILLGLPQDLYAQAQTISVQTPAESVDAFDFGVTQMDENGLVVTLNLRDFTLSEQVHDGVIYQALSVSGMFLMTSPGQPQLPSLGKLIGTPETGIANIRILELTTETLTDVILSPTPSIESIGVATREQFTFNAESYSLDQLQPSAPVTIGSTGKLREQSVAQLLFHPFQYNAAQQTLLIHRSLTAAIELSAPPQRSSATGLSPDALSTAVRATRSSPYEGILQSALLNYAGLNQASIPQEGLEIESHLKEDERLSPSGLSIDTATQRDGITRPRLKIIVDEDGIYRVPYIWMRSIGFNLDDVDPRNLQLQTLDQPMAMVVSGEADGKFDLGDWILFYGQRSTSQFSPENAYWLSVGDEPGLRMADRNGKPQVSEPPTTRYLRSEHWEVNQEYWKDLPLPEGLSDDPLVNDERDHWFWERFPAAPASTTYPFTLLDVIEETVGSLNPLEGLLTVRLHGRTATSASPDHHTQLFINGTQVDDFWWDGQIPLVRQISVSQALLREGENHLEVTLPGDTEAEVDSIYFDYFKVAYWSEQRAEADQLELTGPGGNQILTAGNFSNPGIEVYDIREPLNVSRILNGEVQSEAPRGEAARYQITFADSQPSASRYWVMQAAQKQTPLTIEMVNPPLWKMPENQADYLIITHPDFLDAVAPLAAFRNEKGLVTKVIDVTQLYDEFSHGLFTPQAIRDFLAYAYHNWQPPAPLYVLLVGDANYDYQNFLRTYHPNLVPTHLFDSPIIGQTPTDNWYVSVSGDDFLPDMFVGRIAATTPAEVKSTIDKILAYESDSTPGAWAQRSLFVAEDEANFQSVSDQLIEQLPYNYSATRVYGEDYPNPPDATPQILDAIDQGISLLTFIGHGSVTGWFWDEQILSMEDIALMDNGPDYPFLITGSCNNGLFAHPSQKKSFAEVFTQAEGRGGIGVWSPTGLGYTYWHEKLIEALYGQFFDQGQTALGPATTAAKIEAYAQLGWREPVEISTLFGDPALELHVAQPKIVMAVQSLTKEAVPGQPYAYEIVIANYGNATATNLTVLTQVDSNLTFKSASPMPDQGQNLWTIEELAAGTAQAIGITVEVAQPLTDGTAIDFAAILSRQTQLITVQRADTQVRNITIAPAPTPVPTSTPSNPDEPIILPPLLQDPSIEEPIGENLSPHLYMPLLLR